MKYLFLLALFISCNGRNGNVELVGNTGELKTEEVIDDDILRVKVPNLDEITEDDVDREQEMLEAAPDSGFSNSVEILGRDDLQPLLPPSILEPGKFSGHIVELKEYQCNIYINDEGVLASCPNHSCKKALSEYLQSRYAAKLRADNENRLISRYSSIRTQRRKIRYDNCMKLGDRFKDDEIVRY